MIEVVGKTREQLVDSLRQSAREIREGVRIAHQGPPASGPGAKVWEQAIAETMQQAADLEQAATILEELGRDLVCTACVAGNVSGGEA